MRFCEELEIQKQDRQNKSVNKLLGQARNEASITSDLSELYL